VGKRIAAVLLDGLLVVAACIPGYVLIFIGAAAASGGSAGESAGALFLILGYVLVLVGALGVWLYNVYLLGKDGASLGKRWMKLVVLDQSNNPLGFGKAFLRELVKGIISNICIILLLWPLWDKEQQGLPDKVFSTHVYEA